MDTFESSKTEGERFELSVGCPTPRFQRGALDRYANPPDRKTTTLSPLIGNHCARLEAFISSFARKAANALLEGLPLATVWAR